MKRAVQLICLRDKAKIALFLKLSNFYFKTPPGANPWARQRSENPTPVATRMCESPGVARGGGWSGLGLTDTLRTSATNPITYGILRF